MGFVTTGHCPYRCKHCIENACPENPREFIDTNIIKLLIAQATWMRKFSREVVFTGGEIFTSYETQHADYVPDLLTFCKKNSIGADIKSNLYWMQTPLKDKIISDLKSIAAITKMPEQNVCIKTLPKPSFQLSMSLDGFHKNSLQNCADTIHALAKDRDNSIMFHTSGFESDATLVAKLNKRLSLLGIRCDQMIMSISDQARPEAMTIVNDTHIMQQSTATLIKAGRGNQLKNAKEPVAPQFQIIDRRGYLVMNFRYDGTVILGTNNGGRKIRTTWKTAGGGVKSLARIRWELALSALREELRAKFR
ncbi:MAG: hypothetical protein LBJ73_02265 [Rickettsiales bacterium]|jgi:organic radical activating enzyme|nr:hypothetical protein [Rickettsiales bacterium]